MKYFWFQNITDMKPILLAILSITLCHYTNAQISPVGTYDNCNAAINLIVNTTCVTGADTYTTVGATASPQASVDVVGADDDVWFKFTTQVGQTAAQINIMNSAGSYNNRIEVWASCNAANDIGNTLGNTLNVSSLSPNTTYYVRVYTTSTINKLTTFQMCIVNNTPPPAFPNDECAFATAIPISANPVTCTPVSITNINSTASANPPSCMSSSYRDIWLKFTPSSGNSVKLLLQNYTANIGSSSPAFYAAVYSGSCASLSLIECGTVFLNNEITLSATYTSGVTYYIRLLCANTDEGSFEVCLKQVPSVATYPISADSTCTKAIPIHSSTNLSAAYTEGATNGIRVVNQRDCYGYNSPNALAWYSFTVPNNGNYFVDFIDFVRLSLNQNGAGFRILKRTSCYTTGTDTIITKPPAGTYDTVLCVSSILYGNQSVSLNAGTQYYLTVMENSYNGGRVAYKVRVVGATPPSNDESTGAITVVQDVTCTAGSNATTTRFSTLSINPSPSALAGSGTFTQDVWYKFVATTTTVNIVVSRPSASTRIAIYESNATTLKYDPTTNSSSITINALTVGNTYYIRIINTSGTPVTQEADFTLCVFGPSSSIADAVVACTSSDATQTSTNSSTWLNFTRSGKKILSIFDGPAFSGATFTPRGIISVKYFTNSGGMRLNAGTAVLDRNFEISDGGNNFSNSPVKVRFYFTVAEFNTLIANAASGGISAPYEIKIYRIPGASCTSNIPPSGLYYNVVGFGHLFEPTAPAVATGYYVDMITPNFSGFFLQYADNSLLPAVCGNFNYRVNNDKVVLTFSTQTENNVAAFEIQRSENGFDFTTIATVEAKNTATGSSYQYIDENIKPNKTYYYRLKQTDKDGKEQFICKTIQVKVSGKTTMFSNAYPNPVKSECKIDILKPITGKADIQIVNMMGQIVHQQTYYLLPSHTQLNIQTGSIKAGIYSVRIVTASGSQAQQIIKM